MTESEQTLPAIAISARVATVRMRDPARRNALDATTIDALLERIRGATRAALDGAADAILIRGDGAAFCAGFDLSACADDPPAVRHLLCRLAECVGELRTTDVPVVARVQGAALAGGCALLTGCDFVVVAADAQIGYPVHRIGISPAVSAPSLRARIGGRARGVLIGNELVDGEGARTLGLATEVAQGEAALDDAVERLLARLLAKGPAAMRATKSWMREVERRDAGDLGRAAALDGRMAGAALAASVGLGDGEEFASMLRAFWAARTKR